MNSKKNQPTTGTLVIVKDRLYSKSQDIYFEKGDTFRIEDPAVLEKLIELGLVEITAKPNSQAEEPISQEK